LADLGRIGLDEAKLKRRDLCEFAAQDGIDGKPPPGAARRGLEEGALDANSNAPTYYRSAEIGIRQVAFLGQTTPKYQKSSV